MSDDFVRVDLLVPACALVTALKAAVKPLHGMAGATVDDSSFPAPRLCYVLECILIHGMRHYASASEEAPFKAVLLSVWAQHATPTAGAPHTKFLQLAALVRQAIAATNIMTSAGFVRAWLRLALNAGLIVDALREILSNAPVVTAFYEDSALFSSVDVCDAMFAVLNTLQHVRFALKWNDESLDSPLKPVVDEPPPPTAEAPASLLSSVWSVVGGALWPTAAAPKDGRPSLIDMCTDPRFCSDAFVDPTIAVPELVMFCLRYLQRMDHVPGLFLVNLAPPNAPTIEAAFKATGAFPDPDTDSTPQTAFGVAGVLLNFLASLPDPPVPHQYFKPFVDCVAIPTATVEDSVASPSMLQQAIDHAAAHAVERHECKSPRCRMYRQLFDQLPYAHRSLLTEVLPFLSRMCGLWDTADGVSPIVVSHIYAMACAIGRAILRPPVHPDRDEEDDEPIVPKVVMDLLRHSSHIVYDTMVRRKEQLKISNAKVDMLAGLRRRQETAVDFHNAFQSELLKRLWGAALGALADEQRVAFHVTSELWVALGFQKSNPTADFRVGGVLALECLVYYAEHFSDQVRRALRRLLLLRPPHTLVYDGSGASGSHHVHGLAGWYPLAVSGVNIAKLLLDEVLTPTDGAVTAAAGGALFHSSHTGAASDVAHRHPALWALMADPDVFPKTFSLCMLTLEATYVADPTLTASDFYRVSMDVIRECLRLLVGVNPLAFHVTELHAGWLRQRSGDGGSLTAALSSPTVTVHFGAEVHSKPAAASVSVLGPAAEVFGRDVPECGKGSCPAGTGADPDGELAATLVTASDILSPIQAAAIERVLPLDHRGYKWSLVYSLTKHGASLETFLSKAKGVKPTLLVVHDSRHCVFGAFVGDAWRSSGAAFYGTGQSFVFSFHNSKLPAKQRHKDVTAFKAYKWTRENNFFQSVTDTYIAVGGGGSFALYLDAELFAGTSGPCGTFGSPCLASAPDFECHKLELWTFVP